MLRPSLWFMITWDWSFLLYCFQAAFDFNYRQRLIGTAIRRGEGHTYIGSSLGSGPACPSTLTPRLSFSRHANSPEADVRGPLVMGLQDSHCGWPSHWRSSWYPLLSRRCWSLTSAWRWGDVSMTSLTVSFRLLASGRQGPGWPG